MKPKAALEKAVKISDGQAELARKLSELTGRPVKQQHIWNWLNRDSELPGEFAIPIEKVTNGDVTRQDLRPDLYPESESQRSSAA